MYEDVAKLKQVRVRVLGPVCCYCAPNRYTAPGGQNASRAGPTAPYLPGRATATHRLTAGDHRCMQHPACVPPSVHFCVPSRLRSRLTVNDLLSLPDRTMCVSCSPHHLCSPALTLCRVSCPMWMSWCVGWAPASSTAMRVSYSRMR
jgi:hypothetical protein